MGTKPDNAAVSLLHGRDQGSHWMNWGITGCHWVPSRLAAGRDGHVTQSVNKSLCLYLGCAGNSWGVWGGREHSHGCWVLGVPPAQWHPLGRGWWSLVCAPVSQAVFWGQGGRGHTGALVCVLGHWEGS